MKDQNQVGNLQLDVNNSFYALLHYNTVSIQLFKVRCLKISLNLIFWGGSCQRLLFSLLLLLLSFRKMEVIFDKRKKKNWKKKMMILKMTWKN